MATPPYTQSLNASAEDYRFVYQQLEALATEHIGHPQTGATIDCIGLSNVYKGNGFRFTPSSMDSDLAIRYRHLREALEKPGREDEASVAAPLRNGSALLSSPEIFELLCNSPHYPYFRFDIEMLKYFADIFAEWIGGSNLFEPCGGFGDKIKLMVQQSIARSRRPKRLIVNDTEETNLNHALTGLADLLSAFSPEPPQADTALLGVKGDWLNEKTYLLRNCTNYEGWPELQTQRNVLEALKKDLTRTVVYLPGAMVNDFPLLKFLQKLHEFFKEGTLFIIGFDHTEDISLLSRYYKEHPLVQQLTLSGVTHACWENLGKRADKFDPRLMGVSVDPLPWTSSHGANIQIAVFAKNNPEKKIPLTPIVKLSSRRYHHILKAAKYEVVGTLAPPSQKGVLQPTRYTTIAFTDPGYGERFRTAITSFRPLS